MTIYELPESIEHPTHGTIPLPGHVDWVEGSDVCDAIIWWLTRDPADDLSDGIYTTGADIGYTMRSGTEADPTIIRFPSSPLGGPSIGDEYGLLIGARSDLKANREDSDGRLWSKIESHAWKYTTFEGGPEGSPRAEWCELRQYRDTAFDDGQRDLTVSCTAGTGVEVTISPALGAIARARINDEPGQSYISGPKADGTPGLFTGGTKNNTAQILSCDVTGTILTLAVDDVCNETRVSAVASLKMPALEPRRNSTAIVPMVAFTSPGAIGKVERTCENVEVYFRRFRIRGTNGDTRANATASTGSKREFWHGIVCRIGDGVTLSELDIRNVYGDHIFFSGTTQAELGGKSDTGIQADNYTFEDIVALGCGRHSITAQGQIDAWFRRCVFSSSRLGIDSEPTSSGPRELGFYLEDVAFEYGTAFCHFGPQGLYPEPPFVLEGDDQVLTDGTNVITVPDDMIDGSSFGAVIEGDNFAPDTRIKRRLAKNRIELTEDTTGSGLCDAYIGDPATYGDWWFHRVDTLTKNGLSFLIDSSPRKGRVYFEFDTTAGVDELQNMTFDARVDGLTFDVNDLLGIEITARAGIQLFAKSGKLQVYEIVDAETVKVRFVADNGTITAQPALLSSRTVDKTATASTVAGDRTVSVGAAFFEVIDHGAEMSHPGLRAVGSVIEVNNGAKSVDMPIPAKATATGTLTVSKRWKGFAAINLAPVWPNWTLDECRNVGPTVWEGGVPGIVNPSPMLLFPNRSTARTVTKCYAPAKVNNPTTMTMAVADVADLPANLTVTSAAGWALIGNWARIATSTGHCIVRYSSRVGNTLVACSLVAGSGAISNGAVAEHVLHRMIGEFTNPGQSYGLTDPDDSVLNNRFPGAADSQVEETPDVTVTLTLVLDDDDAARPYATITAVRSDAAIQRGSVQLYANGVLNGCGFLDASGVAGPFEAWEDAAGAEWTAQWAGGWDTQSADDAVSPPGLIATSVSLDVTPVSPSDAVSVSPGLEVEMLVTPEPNDDLPGTVTLYVDGLDEGGGEAGAGIVATSTILPVGTHTLTAAYTGSITHAPSSTTITYESEAPPVVDSDPPEVLTYWPPADATGIDHEDTVRWTYTESVLPGTTNVLLVLTDSFTAIPGELVAVSDTERVFTPTESLPANAEITVILADGADASGNVMDPFLWSFTTAPPPARTHGRPRAH